MLTNKKILMVVAPENYREEELFIPKIIFEKHNAEVYIFSKDVPSTKSTDGTVINVDKQLSEINLEEFSAVVFIGGPGAKIYFDDKEIHELAKKALKQKKLLAAICIAPSILANAGLLKGIKATCYPSEKNNLESKGAIFVKQNVVTDKNIVTADGPKSAKEFADKITEMLVI